MRHTFAASVTAEEMSAFAISSILSSPAIILHRCPKIIRAFNFLTNEREMEVLTMLMNSLDNLLFLKSHGQKMINSLGLGRTSFTVNLHKEL